MKPRTVACWVAAAVLAPLPAAAADTVTEAMQAAEAAAKQLPKAHETLEQVRELVADLHRRNDGVVYSDAMSANHAEMEHVLDDGAKMPAMAQGPMLLMARVSTLEYLAKRLRSRMSLKYG